MISLLASSLLFAAPVPPEIEDEQVLGVNKLPYHSTLIPYENLQEALRADRARSGYARSLNGPWKFNWVKRPEERPVDFYKADYDVSGWKTLDVPSCWQVKGYGTPYYKNLGYIFQKDWPRVMSEPPKDWTAYDERNPVGSYRRTFEVPAGWEGRETFLKFDGVDAGFFLWINGEKVGYSQNSRNAAEFDVTKYLRKGANDIAVEVYRFTAGSYMEDMDMWRLSGIFRNVTLWSAPKVHVADTFVETDLDKDYRDATLKVGANIQNLTGSDTEGRTLVATLYDPQGRQVRRAEAAVPPIERNGNVAASLTIPVENPLKWSAETPTLYTTVVTLEKDGKVEETLSHRTGFRKVEIKGRIFMVNGKPVKLKGANRHEMSPETGHTVSEADMIQDLVMLKKANCNHVRTSHYSNDPRWYELCDEWGIYLVAEANVECHGYYNVLDREPRFERMIVDRNVANVENFKNHPSVLIWSMGNECGGGANMKVAERTVRAMDPSRPTHYEAFGDEFNGNPASIESHMYTDPASLEGIAKDPKRTVPMYLCEYAHAMNNSMGSIGEYNDLFDKYPALMGGAIWEWEDQGLWNRRDPKRPYIAYGGGFGEKPNDEYFIHKGVVFSDRSPKPHFVDAKRAYQWIGFTDWKDGKLTVKNRFAFTDLSKYALRWTLTADGSPFATGTQEFPAVAPGETATVALSVPKIKPGKGTEYFLNVSALLKTDEKWAPKGYDVANGQFELPHWTAPAAEIKGPSLIQTSPAGDITVTGPGYSVAFDRATGTISSLKRNGVEVLLPGGGPKPHLWRAQHRNDDGWAAGGWQQAGLMDLKPEVLDLTGWRKTTGGAAEVTSSVRYVGKGGFALTHLAHFTIYPDGTIAVDNALSPSGPKITLARMGVRMLLDRRMDALTYLARGPMENYADRKRGSDVGRYASTVDAQMTPYPKPQECGNHEDLRWLALGGQGLPTLAVQAADAPLQFSALPYRDEEMEDVPYRVDLPKSKATALIVSGRTLGVGSAACGPRPLPQYRLDTTPRTFSYVLKLGVAKPGRLTVPAKRPLPPLVVAQNGKVALEGKGVEYSVDDRRNWIASSTVAVSKPTRLWLRSDGSRYVVAVEPPPAKLSWKATASSFERGEGDPQHALDGDAATFWHTRWSGTAAKPPHSLVLDLNKPEMVGRLTLTPRQDGRNGRIREYEVYLSDDGHNWGAAAAKGRLSDRDEPQTIRIATPRRARQVKLVILSEHTNGGWATLAELDIAP